MAPTIEILLCPVASYKSKHSSYYIVLLFRNIHYSGSCRIPPTQPYAQQSTHHLLEIAPSRHNS